MQSVLPFKHTAGCRCHSEVGMTNRFRQCLHVAQRFSGNARRVRAAGCGDALDITILAVKPEYTGFILDMFTFEKFSMEHCAALSPAGKIVGDLRPSGEVQAVLRCVLLHSKRHFEFSNLEPYKIVRLKIDVDILPWMPWRFLSERASHLSLDFIFKILGDFSLEAEPGSSDGESVEESGIVRSLGIELPKIEMPFR